MIPQLIAMLKRSRFEFYVKPYQLNIIGIRSPETNSNRFDDELHVLFRDAANRWNHFKYTITTDPGTYWLKNPSQVDGTAILKAGQYVNAYKIGLHKGQYKALVQNKKVTVIRDYDRNAILDFFNGNEATGFFGINIHRSSATGSSKNVDKWSAGCQVFQSIKEFNHFLALCELHRKKYGNQFTYTLIDLRTFTRYKRRMLTYGVVGVSLVIGGLTFWYLKTKKESHVGHS